MEANNPRPASCAPVFEKMLLLPFYVILVSRVQLQDSEYVLLLLKWWGCPGLLCAQQGLSLLPCRMSLRVKRISFENAHLLFDLMQC